MKLNLSGAPNVSNDYALFRSRRQQRPLEDILEDIQQTAALPLPMSRTLPAEAYTNDAFYEWEMENILRKDWVCVAHLSQLPQAGDFLNLDLLDEPVIVVHGKDGVVRTLSRVCPHRAMDIMPPGFELPGHSTAEARGGSPCAGHTRIFMCPYHAWTFEPRRQAEGLPGNARGRVLRPRRDRAEDVQDGGLERLRLREL
ncbi:MAG: Rieske 2Fe-2S domain-containing protein [Chthoniobacteraceae bacterium]